MIPVAEARERILAAFSPLPAEQVALGDGLGRVLAEAVVARRSQPPADVSSMDGYAVRARDVGSVPVTLRQIGESAAGSAYAGSVSAGETVRIFTGAPLPSGADCVVIQEDTETSGCEITVLEAAGAGQHVRKGGLDFRTGDVGIAAGRVLGARDIALAAAMNCPWLNVRRRPRVAILATGDEVVMPGDPVGPDQIVSSNSIALAAVVKACGGDPVMLGIAPDDVDVLRIMIDGAQGHDLLVTTGGVSVGDRDLVRRVLDQEGMALDFWRVAIRPGKPLMFGELAGVPVIGLPGNPVSALVCALLFIRPALATLLGASLDSPESDRMRTVRLARALPANGAREDYMRATLARAHDGEMTATPFDVQDSSMLSLLAKSDCLLVRPPRAPAAAEGDPVEIIPFPAGLCRL